jgi:uncharacterized membrane protein
MKYNMIILRRSLEYNILSMATQHYFMSILHEPHIYMFHCVSFAPPIVPTSHSVVTPIFTEAD